MSLSHSLSLSPLYSHLSSLLTQSQYYFSSSSAFASTRSRVSSILLPLHKLATAKEAKDVTARSDDTNLLACLHCHWSMDFGTRMGSAARISSVLPAAAGASSLYASPEHLCTLPYQVDNTLRVDGLLNFSGHAHDFRHPEDATTTNHVHNRDAQFHTASDHLNSASMSSCFGSPQSPLDHLYVPFEEVAELEWLSKFVDESFSDQISNTYQYAGPIIPSSAQAQLRWVDSAASGGATAHVAWTSWLPLSSVAQTSPSSSSSSSSSTEFPVSSMPPSSVGSSSGRGKKGGGGNAGKEGGVRRCTHCASEKTPQWRTGPLGPKTLCNACGVRYKSGRLVPEYRPAASPTFVLTRHSNSHRKVLELRRQKELLLLKNADGATTSAASWPELHFDSHHHQQNGVC